MNYFPPCESAVMIMGRIEHSIPNLWLWMINGQVKNRGVKGDTKPQILNEAQHWSGFQRFIACLRGVGCFLCFTVAPRRAAIQENTQYVEVLESLEGRGFLLVGLRGREESLEEAS